MTNRTFRPLSHRATATGPLFHVTCNIFHLALPAPVCLRRPGALLDYLPSVGEEEEPCGARTMVSSERTTVIELKHHMFFVAAKTRWGPHQMDLLFLPQWLKLVKEKTLNECPCHGGDY